VEMPLSNKINRYGGNLPNREKFFSLHTWALSWIVAEDAFFLCFNISVEQMHVLQPQVFDSRPNVWYMDLSAGYSYKNEI